jgi:hypothetical protein
LDERLLYLETHQQQLIEVLSKHYKQTLNHLTEFTVPRYAPEQSHGYDGVAAAPPCPFF